MSDLLTHPAALESWAFWCVFVIVTAVAASLGWHAVAVFFRERRK